MEKKHKGFNLDINWLVKRHMV